MGNRDDAVMHFARLTGESDGFMAIPERGEEIFKHRAGAVPLQAGVAEGAGGEGSGPDPPRCAGGVRGA